MEMIYIGEPCHYLTVGKAYSVILSQEGYFRVNSDRYTTCSYNLENFLKNFISQTHYKQYSQHKIEKTMSEQQNTENEVIVTIKSINYSGKWMEFWFDEDFEKNEDQSCQFCCKTYKFWELVECVQDLRQDIDINGVKGLKIKLKLNSMYWDIIEIIQNKPMSNQQKQLQLNKLPN
jgi:hypothetical protein